MGKRKTKLKGKQSIKSLPKSGDLFTLLKKAAKDESLSEALKGLSLPETVQDLEKEESWADWLLDKAKTFGPLLVEYLPELLAAL